MTTSLLKDKLLAQVDQLPHNLQQRVLDFATMLSPKGVKGQSLLRFEGFIPADEIRRMSQAIDDACEKVDVHEW